MPTETTQRPPTPKAHLNPYEPPPFRLPSKLNKALWTHLKLLEDVPTIKFLH